jgi:hypothetical protein
LWVLAGHTGYVLGVHDDFDYRRAVLTDVLTDKVRKLPTELKDGGSKRRAFAEEA